MEDNRSRKVDCESFARNSKPTNAFITEVNPRREAARLRL